MTDGTVVSPSPPRPSRPRRGDRLHALLAGMIAVLALLGCILVVNLLNDPTSDSAHRTAAAGGSGPATPAGPPPAGAAAPATTPKPSTHPATSSPPSPKVTSQAPSVSASARSDGAGAKRVFAPVVILNNSQEKGLAEAARARLEAAGFPVTRVGNYNSTYNVPVPTVFYDADHKEAAQTLRDLISDVRQATPKSETKIASGDPLILVVTKDFPTTITQ